MIEYIRRDKAIDAIENVDADVIEEWDGTAEFGYTIDRIRCALNHVPAETDVAPVRHGRWEGYTRSRYCGCDEAGEPIYRDGVVYYCSEPP